jgi:nitroreductase
MDSFLGTTWVRWFDPQLLRELFALPARFEPVVILPIGYPAPDVEISGMHVESKPLEDLLF